MDALSGLCSRGTIAGSVPGHDITPRAEWHAHRMVRSARTQIAAHNENTHANGLLSSHFEIISKRDIVTCRSGKSGG